MQERIRIQTEAIEETSESGVESQVQQLQLGAELADVREMLGLLHCEERRCVAVMDVKAAKQTRMRIEVLAKREEELAAEWVAARRRQENADADSHQEELLQCFLQCWEQFLADLVRELAAGEEKLLKEQTEKKEESSRRWEIEKEKGFKPSCRLTEQRRKIVALIKIQRYDDAEAESQEAHIIETEERRQWEVKVDERRRHALQLLERKQTHEFAVLRRKNEGLLMGKLKERDNKLDILMKKHQVRRVQLDRNAREMARTVSAATLSRRLQ